MIAIVVYFKYTLFTIQTFIHTAIASLLYLTPYAVRIRVGPRILRSWAFTTRMIFGIRVHHVNQKPSIRNGTMVISNHVTFWDIFVLGSAYPTVFLSKKEVFHIPILGQGAHAAGVLFVDRASARSGAKSIRMMARALKAGGNLISFPEGTTFSDKKVHNFKSGTFQAAHRAGVPVQPMALAYRDHEKEGWSNQSMGAHFFERASHLTHDVAISFGEQLISSDFHDANDLKQHTHNEIEKQLKNALAYADREFTSV